MVLARTQCSDGTAKSPWDGCNYAVCNDNDCVVGISYKGCVGDKGKEENELCDLTRDNCNDGLECVDQNDGCDNDVGRCKKLGKE